MQTSKKLQLDLNNVNHGYFIARSLENKRELKLQVSHFDTTLYYSLNNKGESEVFPLQLGNGDYVVTLYKRIIGKRYISAGRIKFHVDMEDENEVYLYYNQYVQKNTKLAEVARHLLVECDGYKTYQNIREYIKSNYTYDFVRAVFIKGDVLPDVETCFNNKMGICQDLAALAVSMFRSVGIPAKLRIGYADKQYHAWVSVLLNGKWRLYDPTLAVAGMKKPEKYVVERWY